MIRNLQLILITLVGCLTCSCGYQFSGSGSTLPPDIKTLAIVDVRNQTTEPQVGLKLKENLELRFERYGVVELSEDPERADALLTCTITSIDDEVKTVTGQTDIELESDLLVTLSAAIKRRNGQIIWSNPNLVVRNSFASTSGAVVTSSSNFAQGDINTSALASLSSREVSRVQQEQALEDLLEEAARKIYLESVAESF